jgi:S-adenosyl-L-methionine hydrolase (adenosine-forming)
MATITFLSDYGYSDDFVGVCHGVIARIAPDAAVIDVSHRIARHDIRSGALILARALPYMPAGIHLAVVDPGVGGTRRAVAIRCVQGGRVLVGPDNGLLTLAAKRFGGAIDAIDLEQTPHRLEHVSATFHGRDVFAPVAAALANGSPFSAAGEPLDPSELVELALPSARRQDGRVIAHALVIDGYGNVTLDAPPTTLADAGLAFEPDLLVNGTSASYARVFGDVPRGTLLVYEDSYGAVALAINGGSAARELGLALDDEVMLERA